MEQWRLSINQESASFIKSYLSMICVNAPDQGLSGFEPSMYGFSSVWSPGK